MPVREECPHCGAELPPNARVCPECGSDETTGWSDSARAADLGLPEDEFNYDEFVRREFEGKTPKKRIRWIWWIVALALAVWLAVFWLR